MSSRSAAAGPLDNNNEETFLDSQQRVGYQAGQTIAPPVVYNKSSSSSTSSSSSSSSSSSNVDHNSTGSNLNNDQDQQPDDEASSLLTELNMEGLRLKEARGMAVQAERTGTLLDSEELAAYDKIEDLDDLNEEEVVPGESRKNFENEDEKVVDSFKSIIQQQRLESESILTDSF
jgi:hypothetical protein